MDVEGGAGGDGLERVIGVGRAGAQAHLCFGLGLFGDLGKVDGISGIGEVQEGTGAGHPFENRDVKDAVAVHAAGLIALVHPLRLVGASVEAGHILVVVFGIDGTGSHIETGVVDGLLPLLVEVGIDHGRTAADALSLGVPRPLVGALLGCPFQAVLGAGVSTNVVEVVDAWVLLIGTADGGLRQQAAGLGDDLAGQEIGVHIVLAAGVQDGLSVAVPLGKVGAAEDGLDSGLGVVAVVVDVHKEEDVLLIEIVSGIHVVGDGVGVGISVLHRTAHEEAASTGAEIGQGVVGLLVHRRGKVQVGLVGNKDPVGVLFVELGQQNLIALGELGKLRLVAVAGKGGHAVRWVCLRQEGVSIDGVVNLALVGIVVGSDAAHSVRLGRALCGIGGGSLGQQQRQGQRQGEPGAVAI